MKARKWMTAGAVALLALSAGTAVAQGPNAGTMVVVIKFNADKNPWDYAVQMGSATAMPLLGVSPSTNSAVFTVPNETSLAYGTVAGKNQQTLVNGFPGAIFSYNYGENYPAPTDIQATRPAVQAQQGYTGGRRFRGQYGQNRFTDQTRQAIRQWSDQNRTLATQLRVGMMLDATTREMGYEAPSSLRQRLAPVPTNYRYLVIGGNVVLIDGNNYVVDMAPIN